MLISAFTRDLHSLINVIKCFTGQLTSWVRADFVAFGFDIVDSRFGWTITSQVESIALDCLAYLEGSNYFIEGSGSRVMGYSYYSKDSSWLG